MPFPNFPYQKCASCTLCSIKISCSLYDQRVRVFVNLFLKKSKNSFTNDKNKVFLQINFSFRFLALFVTSLAKSNVHAVPALTKTVVYVRNCSLGHQLLYRQKLRSGVE